MRIHYNVTGNERKALVKVIAETTGAKAEYKGMPTAAYEIDYFTVTKDGALEFSDRSDSEEVEAVLESLAAAGFDGVGETQETTTEAQEDEPDRLTISLPLTGHTENSLRNLVTMVYSRGSLISKATGGIFSCTLAQVDALKDCINIPDFLTRITPELIGLDFSDGKVNFTGFPFTEDADRVKAFTQLAAQMNKLAKEQKRTMAKTVDATNEKYIFRIWLLALGMGGEEFKTARRVLLHSLTGSAAFKDQAMEDRWKAKQAAKPDAAKGVTNSYSPVTEEEETA